MNGCMYVLMYEYMDVWMYVCMDVWMDVWMYGICMDVCTDVCMDGWMKVWMDDGCMDVWMCGWIDGCMDGSLRYLAKSISIAHYSNSTRMSFSARAKLSVNPCAPFL